MNVSRFFLEHTNFRELSTIYTFLLLVKRVDYLMIENYRI